ncbi:MAG: DUF1552 domain-containing protein [Planctomycetes bacterium]|nr:DUF1552 domain-containing protein [Planctomycetota bacterium]
MSNRLSRRTLLRGAGVAIALPVLDCMIPSLAARESKEHEPRRMIAINMGLSFHPPNLIPTKAGRDYEVTRYLKPLNDLRNDFTIISGTSHSEVDGGHAASKSWLTAAPHPGAANFKNSISIDQLAAKSIGLQTRFATMALGTGISVSANGVQVPGHLSPSKHFGMMFLDGRPAEKQHRIERLREGRSVLDTVLESSRRMRSRVSRRDKAKLDEYFTSVREAERQLFKSEKWEHKPKPKVDAKPPVDIRDSNDIINRARQLYDVMYLALLTDSTRLITYAVGDSNSVATLPGVSMGYHNLSHHGKDPEKLEQLAIVESEHVKAFGDFLRRLKASKEGDSNLLDRTMVLLGSHMHSGGHNNRNLPIILAGGGFRHGQHLAFDRDNNNPLANLYVTMLQRLGLEVDRFASSTGTLTGLELRG